MSKVYNYIVGSVLLIFLLKIAGLPSGLDVFINWMGLGSGASGFAIGDLFNSFDEILTISGLVTGIVIGFLVKSSPESAIVSPLATTLLATVANTFISILNYTEKFGYIYQLMYLIFIPLLAGFGIALISYWRGSDG